jgi:hypothetical protein
LDQAQSGPFAAFWEAYPNKSAKQDALKAFRALAPDAELRQVMHDALAKWRASERWMKEGGKYVPLPATWLRGRRWEDELPSNGYGGAVDAGAAQPAWAGAK